MISLMLTTNPYGAAVLAGGSLQTAGISVDAFAQWLNNELAALAEVYKLCWLTFNAAETAFIAPALQHGFVYHHVQGLSLIHI